jgi:hypothetical protein
VDHPVLGRPFGGLLARGPFARGSKIGECAHAAIRSGTAAFRPQDEAGTSSTTIGSIGTLTYFQTSIDPVSHHERTTLFVDQGGRLATREIIDHNLYVLLKLFISVGRCAARFPIADNPIFRLIITDTLRLESNHKYRWNS